MPIVVPAALTAQARQKSKSSFAKLNSPEIERALTDLDTGLAKASHLKADPATLVKSADPVTYGEIRAMFLKSFEAERTALLAKAKVATQKLTVVQKNLDPKSDKTLLAFVAEQLKATKAFEFTLQPVATREATYLLGKGYKSALSSGIAAMAVKFLDDAIKDGPGYLSALEADIDRVDTQGTVAAVVATWKNNPNSARSYAVWLGTWLQAVEKPFPTLATKIAGGPGLGKKLMDLPWMTEIANEGGSQGSNKITASISNSLPESRAVSKAMLEYHLTVKKAYKLFDYLTQARAAITAAERA